MKVFTAKTARSSPFNSGEIVVIVENRGSCKSQCKREPCEFNKSGKVPNPNGGGRLGAALPVNGSLGSLPHLLPTSSRCPEETSNEPTALLLFLSNVFLPDCSTHYPTPRVLHPWPHPAYHVPPIRRPSSLAPQDAAGYLNRHTVTVAYVP